ncbi:uncharacterized protein LOC122813731 [Protopterus annectens]|uniref:uncharacterized protein LOC122813731 n=1 Tax=Protopterus annectens TaxID=7888 RepID=UPI001CFB6868|nr:uncharacterized protein LOC122813731 [Protopterus annectens]
MKAVTIMFFFWSYNSFIKGFRANERFENVVLQRPDVSVKGMMDSITMSCTLTNHQNHTQIQDVSIKWKGMHKNRVPASYSNDKYVLPEEFQGRAYVRWFQHNLTSIFHICDLLVNDTDVYKCQITFRVSDHLETAEGNGSRLNVTDFGHSMKNDSMKKRPTHSTPPQPWNGVRYMVICTAVVIMGALIYIYWTKKGHNYTNEDCHGKCLRGGNPNNF